MADEYGKTLNLPKTDFSMRANLPEREPELLSKWEQMDLYNALLKHNENQPKFILHDGPPFANGNIHIGHTLNKILKDVVVKYNTMSGFYAPYVPGWDTHGLPIERQVIKSLKVNKNEIQPAEFRKICRDFALKYVDNQREQFKRLGVIGDWENPYLTLDPSFEAAQIRVFGEMVSKNYIYKGLKPVYWCTDCETALAEAEIEYNEDKTNSIYVKFPVVKSNLDFSNLYFVIWTTTTWTLPGNVAIAVNPAFEYAVVKSGNEHYIMAKELVDASMHAEYEIVATVRGKDLEYIECSHPFLPRNSLVILGDHVTLDAGTGCVHTAPGHGIEDYVACRNYPELPIVVPVDAKGVLNEEAGKFAGMYYAKSNSAIIEELTNSGLLFGSTEIIHQYPHCWRCHSPIVFRAAEQWFASIDDIKDAALAAIKSVKWYPAWGEDRISSMVSDRSDWCISRQRLWGMPIPIFYCDECNEPVLNVDVINGVADIFEKEGSNAWFERNASEMLPNGFKCKCGCGSFKKEKDTMDVWFDSGTSHVGVLESRPDLESPCDLYLEGNDQYRGWFQSSLLTSVAHSGKAPFKAVVTHGFVIDEEKQKMSKSLGNGLPPEDIIKEYGADILRLWAVSSDYKTDIRISKEILKQLSEIYRKIRNTARYMLGNLYDYNPDEPVEDLNELDRWALMRVNKLAKKVQSAYSSYEYHILYHAIHNFCARDMSNFYLDIIKDRLYTEAKDSKLRRSSQTAMYEILSILVRLITPVLSFTAEEIWSYMPKKASENCDSIFFSRLPIGSDFAIELEEKWDKILEIRDIVSKSLENARADKLIGNSLEANIMISASGKDYEFLQGISADLAQLFIVSKAELAEAQGAITVEVKKSDGDKCPRCWMYSDNTSKDGLCARCASVVEEIS